MEYDTYRRAEQEKRLTKIVKGNKRTIKEEQERKLIDRLHYKSMERSTSLKKVRESAGQTCIERGKSEKRKMDKKAIDNLYSRLMSFKYQKEEKIQEHQRV